MPGDEILVACVGKPSAGKSSFLNAVTDANAKVGNYPFTTIEPNRGVTFYPTECPCKRFDKSDQCRPRYGRCDNGTRWVPVQMLDVAGLIPGASEGLGLGNKFLDDLRHADVLIHVVDVSGTTNAKGEATTGYDPSNDIDWLRGEIHSWIYHNLHKKWEQVVRRHVATRASIVETLQLQLSGYGASHRLILELVDALGSFKPLDQWNKDEDLRHVVDVFLNVRFPTVVALNKIDVAEADKNIAKLARKYDESMLVYTSALAEMFLRKAAKSGFIRYYEGTDRFDLAEEENPPGEPPLKPADDKMRARLEKIRDLVLYRYGSTGCTDAIRRAVDVLKLVPLYPVRNINNFSSDSGGRQNGVFRDCILVRPGTTVREAASLVSHDVGRFYAGAETVGGVQLGESDVITSRNNIISFTLSRQEP